MSKQYKFILILCFIVSLGVSFVLGRQSVDVQSPTFQDVPKNELIINWDFLEMKPMTYSSLYGEEFLHTTISLTDKGKKYLSTDLYAKEYNIRISLMNSSTNDVYLTYSSLKWNTDHKSFDFLIKRKDMESDEIRKDFDLQLEKMKKNIENNLAYTIEMNSQFNSEHVMTLTDRLRVQ